MLSINVFARAEYTHLKRIIEDAQGRKLWRLLLVCNLLFATIPFISVDHYADIPFHTIIGIGLILFCLLHHLHTINMAIGAIDHEKQNRTWEILLLTNVHSRSLMMGKWWAVVRSNLGTVFLLGITKLALAYSVMQYLNLYPSWIDEAINDLTRPFIYMSFTDWSATTPIAYYPQFWQVGFALIVLSLLSFAEIGLLASLGMLVNFIKVNWLPIKLLLAGFMRLILCGIGLFAVSLIGNLEITYWSHHYLDGNTPATYWGCDHDYLRKIADYYAWCVIERDHRRIFETAQVSASALVDNGILLAAGIMRPIGSFQFALRNLLSAVITLLGLILVTSFNLLTAARCVHGRVT